MSQPPPRAGGLDDDLLVSARGAYRVLVATMGLWSFFAGFALLTQGFGPLSLGEDDVAERVVGAHMIVLTPVYGLLAWRRDEYRLLAWIPYAAQVAIILPLVWELVADQELEGAFLLVVSVIFFALLIYFWRGSHPLDFFLPGDEEDDDTGDDLDEDEQPETGAEPLVGDTSSKTRRYRRSE